MKKPPMKRPSTRRPNKAAGTQASIHHTKPLAERKDLQFRTQNAVSAGFAALVLLIWGLHVHHPIVVLMAATVAEPSAVVAAAGQLGWAILDGAKPLRALHALCRASETVLQKLDSWFKKLATRVELL